MANKNSKKQLKTYAVPMHKADALCFESWGTRATVLSAHWIGRHVPDLLNSSAFCTIRKIGAEPFWCPDTESQTLTCSAPSGAVAPLPREVAGLWLTLVALSTASIALQDAQSGAAYARLEPLARQLVESTYPQYLDAFEQLCD